MTFKELLNSVSFEEVAPCLLQMHPDAEGSLKWYKIHFDMLRQMTPKYDDDANSDVCHITLEEWNHDLDHVHIMFRAQPKTELSKFINAYKSASSRLLKKEFPQIREKLWEETFWSQSFCLLSAGGAPIEMIRQYIESQGEK